LLLIFYIGCIVIHKKGYLPMNSKVNEELDDLCKDFKELIPDFKKGVLLNAKSLLEVHRYGKALIMEGAKSSPVEARKKAD
jgi:hypothetical protein